MPLDMVVEELWPGVIRLEGWYDKSTRWQVVGVSTRGVDQGQLGDAREGGRGYNHRGRGGGWDAVMGGRTR